MSSQYLHIVSFNIPFPANYGGLIDVFYKVKALSEAGIRIILHCYHYGRSPSKELEDLCFKVYYYPRLKGLRYHVQSDPYIVVTRNAKSMPEHLLGDSFPVLFEGLHSTTLLSECVEANKRVLVRAHNVEHRYYRALAGSERSLLKKLFFLWEARKLKSYESILYKSDYILGIARHETEYFQESYGNALLIPAFHRFDECISKEGSGNYILFHGNLGVAENSASFLSLARKEISRLPYQIIVAGKNPSDRFQKSLSAYPNVRLFANPSDQELDILIRDAHVHLVLSRQSTGIKLKLMHALHAGRHCLVSPEVVYSTGLDKLCTVAESKKGIPEKLNELMAQPFTQTKLQERKKALKEYSNRTSAEKIARILA